MNIKVSVIVPVYNAEKSLENTLKSVLRQELKEIEIILVDDGSTDKSGEIINKYKNKDSRIKAIFQKNTGVSGARNTGIKFATGRYIGFVDSDDLVVSDMFIKMYKKAINNNADIVCCGIVLESNYKKIEIKPTNKEMVIKYLFDKEKYIYKDAYIDAWRKGFSECCNKIYKREIINYNNLYFDVNKKYGEDHEFNLKVFTKANNIVLLPDTLYLYNRKNNNSVTRSYLNDMLNIAINGYKYKREFLNIWNMNSDDNINKINYQLVQTLNGCIFNEAKGNGNLTIKQRKDKIEEIIKNDLVINLANNLESQNLKLSQKINIYILKYLNKHALFYIYNIKYYFLNVIKKLLVVKK